MTSLTESFFTTVEDLTRDQKVRAFDIYALGPFLAWISFQKKPLSKMTRRTLLVAGIMIMAYNWKKYHELEQQISKAINETA